MEIHVQELSQSSQVLLKMRGLNQQEMTNFSALLAETKLTSEKRQSSAKQNLLSMSPTELSLLQKANSLAYPISVAGLTEEGAENLLSQPDNSDKVDLNNDGIVEVGEARNIIFPPVNAPQYVKDAWEETTKNMSFSEKSSLELTMHFSIYGVNINGQQQENLPPETQWNKENTQQRFSTLRSNLDFLVNLDGWTEQNQARKKFYDDFETKINTNMASVSSTFSSNNNVYHKNQSSNNSENISGGNEKHSHQSTPSLSEQTIQLINLVLDARLGLDREKLNEIEEKMKAVENDQSLSDEDKAMLLQQLQKEKEKLSEEMAKKMVENEKLKARA